MGFPVCAACASAVPLYEHLPPPPSGAGTLRLAASLRAYCSEVAVILVCG
jgi:hypothetical protein